MDRDERRRALPIVVIADDLTGAADAAAKFSRPGRAARVHLAGELGIVSGDVTVWCTNTRDAGAETAYDAVREAIRRLAGAPQVRIFKKIDSTGRGNVGTELKALVDGSAADLVVACPAFPDQDRSFLDGRIVVGRDDAGIGGDMIRDTAGDLHDPAAHVDLSTVRSGAETLAASLAAAGGLSPVVLCDAVTNDDLVAIASAAEACGHRVVLVGSAGLAAAASMVWSDTAGAPAPPALGAAGIAPLGRLPLAIMGSDNPVSRRQVETAVRGGWIAHPIDPFRRHDGFDPAESARRLLATLDVAGSAPGVVVFPGEPARRASGEGDERRATAERLGAVGAHLIESSRFDCLVLGGGETAAAALALLGCSGLEIEGELASGIPRGRAVGGTIDGMPIVLKAGGFGSDAALLEIGSWFTGGRHER